MVDIELMSNWGHERLVGLTEIELFDLAQHRIDIDASFDVSLASTAAASDLDLAALNASYATALFNKKCKV